MLINIGRKFLQIPTKDTKRSKAYEVKRKERNFRIGTIANFTESERHVARELFLVVDFNSNESVKRTSQG